VQTCTWPITWWAKLASGLAHLQHISSFFYGARGGQSPLWPIRGSIIDKPAEEINEAAESDVYKSCASFLDAVATENRSCRRPVTDHGGGSCGTAFDLGGIFAEESDLDEKENE